MKIQSLEILEGVEEKFIAVEVKSVDAKNRVNIGEKLFKRMNAKSRVDAYKVFLGEEGDILLRPIMNVPSREAWIYENQEVLGSIRQGLAEAGEGELKKVRNLKTYLKNL